MFDLINEFHDICASGELRSDSANVLTKLVAYAGAHFKHEEGLMAANAYPALDYHREQHAALVESIFKLHARFAANQLASDAGTRNFLQHWLLDHILKDDMDYRDFRLRQCARAVSKEAAQSAGAPIEGCDEAMTATA
jgi:hemerythrin-like metal-binding protein